MSIHVIENLYTMSIFKYNYNKYNSKIYMRKEISTNYIYIYNNERRSLNLILTSSSSLKSLCRDSSSAHII